jgi:cytochrome o ubiquinol oxidase operon protein cyoD
MTKPRRAVVVYHNTERNSLATYVTGYIFSIYLTASAYLIVYNHLFSHLILTISIIGLALIQFIVQMVFFLHLGKETKPRWKLGVMLMMILIVLILVGGSLWIMTNLTNRMSPTQENNYMNDQQGL